MHFVKDHDVNDGSGNMDARDSASGVKAGTIITEHHRLKSTNKIGIVNNHKKKKGGTSMWIT